MLMFLSGRWPFHISSALWPLDDRFSLDGLVILIKLFVETLVRKVFWPASVLGTQVKVAISAN
jgi:hypothetical protein